MVSAICRRVKAMVRLVTISTITKICAVSARVSGSSTPRDRAVAQDRQPDHERAREKALGRGDERVEPEPGPHRGERQDEGRRDCGVSPEPEDTHHQHHDGDARRPLQYVGPVGSQRERACPASRCIGDPAAEEQPEGPDGRHRGGVAPPAPGQQVPAVAGDEGHAEQGAQHGGEQRGRDHDQRAGSRSRAAACRGTRATRPPDAGDEAAQRQDRDHGLEDGDQREDRPGHSALGEEQDQRRWRPRAERCRAYHIRRVLAGEPDHGDTGGRPDQPDVLGLDDGDPSQQAGADVCHQPGRGPDRRLHTRTQSFSRPHAVSIVGRAPLGKQDRPIDTMES